MPHQLSMHYAQRGLSPHVSLIGLGDRGREAQNIDDFKPAQGAYNAFSFKLYDPMRGNTQGGLKVPSNLYYYLGYRTDKGDSLPPERSYLPQEPLAHFLRGVTPVALCLSSKEEPQYVGWMEWADDTGCINSGTYSCFTIVEQRVRYGYKSTLVETEADCQKPIRAAANQSKLNNEEDRKTMQQYARRAYFLSVLAEILSRCEREEDYDTLKELIDDHDKITKDKDFGGVCVGSFKNYGTAVTRFEFKDKLALVYDRSEDNKYTAVGSVASGAFFEQPEAVGPPDKVVGLQQPLIEPDQVADGTLCEGRFCRC